MTKPAQNDALDFESALLALEAIVGQMESGSLPLEQSIEAYTRGVALLQTCQKSLNDAEQQVRILTESNQLVAFEPSEP
jgi:exodeoxyribonuclease VII small subunit